MVKRLSLKMERVDTFYRMEQKKLLNKNTVNNETPALSDVR